MPRTKSASQTQKGPDIPLPTVGPDVIQALIVAEYGAPFEILGPHKVEHQGKTWVALRAIWPRAQRVRALSPDGALLVELSRVHPEGLFEGIFPKVREIPDYVIEITDAHGRVFSAPDTYSFPPQLTDFDKHLVAEGTHYRTYEKLGAHFRKVGKATGTHFAVWAPNARRVSVVGDFNGWDGRCHVMRVHPEAGIWELFIPEVKPGMAYKFEIASRLGGPPALKADPYAFRGELRPNTASIVHEFRGHVWRDQKWLKKRAKTSWLEAPMSIYELHLGSWKRNPETPDRPLSYREMAPLLAEYIKDMGFTHVELLPISEYPYDDSWGYQPLGHFAPTSRYGSPEDLMVLIDHLHQNEIGVILDFVPAHFPKDSHGLRRFDGTALYEHADPRKGEHQDWGSLIYNFSRNEVSNFLVSSALFWLEKYHIDGLRVDAVASMLYLDYSRKPGQWVPNIYGGNENLEAVAFLRKFNDVIHKEQPGVITVAEESTSWPGVSRASHLGGLGFNFKWNMGWMHDTLKYMSMDPIFRKFHHNTLTFSLMYAMAENFTLAFSHDEVVHGKGSMVNKMPGDRWQRFASLRLLFGYMFAHPGKKLNFMGSEFGQWSEWNFRKALDWQLLEHEPHRALQRYVRDLHTLYRNEPACYQVDYDYAGFQWVDLHDADHSVLGWLRFAKQKNDFIMVICNFTPVPRYDHRVGVPEPGLYRELINSDSTLYWGSNKGNYGGVRADDVPMHGHPYSLNLTLPPLGFLMFKLARVEPKIHPDLVTAGQKSPAKPPGKPAKPAE